MSSAWPRRRGSCEPAAEPGAPGSWRRGARRVEVVGPRPALRPRRHPRRLLPAIERHTELWAARVGLPAHHVIAASHGRRDAELIPFLAPGPTRSARWTGCTASRATTRTGSSQSPGRLSSSTGCRQARGRSSRRRLARSRSHASTRRAAPSAPPRLLGGRGARQAGPAGFPPGAALLDLPAQECLALEDSAAGAAAAREAGATVLSVGRAPVPGATLGTLDLRTVRAVPTTDGLDVVVGETPTADVAGVSA
ncbi:hypothetical protein NKG05_14600 [Oerskovia sp. M15]